MMGAVSDGVNYLSPEYFRRAQEQYSSAVEQSIARHGAAASKSAEKGLALLDLAVAHATISREIFREVLVAREKVAAGEARRLFPEKYDELETRFQNATKLVEQEKLEEAKSANLGLLNAYASFESLAQDKERVNEAEAALKRAEDKNADEYVPRTFQLAKEELQSARSSLGADHQDIDSIGEHTANAINLAERAIKLTDLAKDFDDHDFEYEDMLLWYQQQIEKIGTALGAIPPFDKGNQEVIDSIRNGIASLVRDNANLALQVDQLRQELNQANERQQQLIREHREELDRLEKRLNVAENSAEKRQEPTKRSLENIPERLEFVQSLFDPSEAKVYVKGKIIVISAQGFHFRPGKSDIEKSNIPLLNKIVDAVQKFPGSNVSVEGYTDWLGKATMNRKLSEERAKNVANYLIRMGNIDAARIFAQGFGETHPIASNQTEEGREANRRIEIEILNK